VSQRIRGTRDHANPQSPIPNPQPDGTEGWDAYAPFYDWENARTLGRRDVAFWRGVARRAGGPVLELGCGTGRVSWPVARAGVDLAAIDRSQAMLDQARTHGRRARGRRPRFVRGDIRALPFGARRFAAVLAPYGILQSILSDRDLAAVLASVARVLRRGGVFGVDLVPDVPNWREYSNKVQLRGRASGGRHLTLVESVRQDPAKRRTTFEQRYLERRGGRTDEHRFELTFRTLTVRAMTARLARAGFAVEAALGDYDGRPWDARADVWILLARLK
jgi:ubiquinone/menaquinone biosynthesis C-methylase UbiE